jgi:hypothetical protein
MSAATVAGYSSFVYFMDERDTPILVRSSLATGKSGRSSTQYLDFLVLGIGVVDESLAAEPDVEKVGDLFDLLRDGLVGGKGAERLTFQAMEYPLKSPGHGFERLPSSDLHVGQLLQGYRYVAATVRIDTLLHFLDAMTAI